MNTGLMMSIQISFFFFLVVCPGYLIKTFPFWFRGLGCFGSLVLSLRARAAASECVCAATSRINKLFWTRYSLV